MEVRSKRLTWSASARTIPAQGPSFHAFTALQGRLRFPKNTEGTQPGAAGFRQGKVLQPEPCRVGEEEEGTQVGLGTKTGRLHMVKRPAACIWLIRGMRTAMACTRSGTSSSSTARRTGTPGSSGRSGPWTRKVGTEYTHYVNEVSRSVLTYYAPALSVVCRR